MSNGQGHSRKIRQHTVSVLVLRMLTAEALSFNKQTINCIVQQEISYRITGYFVLRMIGLCFYKILHYQFNRTVSNDKPALS
jgi:hypothetical protein